MDRKRDIYISACNVSGKMDGWENYMVEMGRVRSTEL